MLISPSKRNVKPMADGEFSFASRPNVFGRLASQHVVSKYILDTDGSRSPRLSSKRLKEVAHELARRLKPEDRECCRKIFAELVIDAYKKSSIIEKSDTSRF